MAKLAPIFNDAQFINAIPANGAKLFTYAAGSSAKLATYTDEDGLVAQANPIILNSRGEPAQPIWLLEGVKYKFVFAPATDTDPPVSPIRTIDDISGINDTSITIDQWVDSGLLPTYVSTTSFTVAGDQTSLFTNKRRLKSFVTAGIAYSTVLSSTFGVLTTVVVVNDSLPLDTGLSNIQVGLLTPDNTSIPSVIESYRATIAATATTTPLWASTAQVQDWTGTPTITDFPDAPRAGVWRVCYPAAGTILTDNANIDVQGDANYTTQSGDKIYIEALTVSTFRVYIERKNGQPLIPVDNDIKSFTAVSNTPANAVTITIPAGTLQFRSATLNNGTPVSRTIVSPISLVISSGSTLGALSGVASRIAVLAIDNAGTVEVAAVNTASGLNLDETTLISTTAEGGAGGADSLTLIYSTTARSSVAYRVIGYYDETQATAGTHVSALTRVQGIGGQTSPALSSNALGNPAMFACRAWVRFNGTGTPAIIGSGNVSSITDNGTGDYTINFITAMPDANYVIAGTARAQASGAVTGIIVEESFDTAPSTSSCRITVKQGSNLFDISSIHVAIFR